MNDKVCLDLLYDNGLLHLVFVEDFARVHPPESWSILDKMLRHGLYLPERIAAHVLGLVKDGLEIRAEKLEGGGTSAGQPQDPGSFQVTQMPKTRWNNLDLWRWLACL